MKKCKCGAVIPAERLAILPNTTSCVKCSTEQPKKGQMVYNHKTAPELVVTDKVVQSSGMVSRRK